MKRLSTLLLMLVVATTSCFSQKVVDKSGRQPKWVNGLQKDYIIVTASGNDVQTAQQNALTMVKEQIVLSVAEHVKATTEMKRQESSYNNSVSNFLETFASTTTSQSGKVPFLQGISITKVEEFYWEKIRRPDKSTYVNYHLKYPFPNIELQKLVNQYKKRDMELTQQLETLLAQVDKVGSVEEIERNIAELKTLQGYFMDGRLDQCKLGVTRYQQLLKSIELVELDSKLGELKYYLRLGERSITTTKKPQTTSECARILSTINQKDAVTIKYDHENCYEDPENNIFVKYRIAGKEVSKKFYFDVTADKSDIFINDPIRFNATRKEGNQVMSSTCYITLVSKYESSFTVEKIELEWPDEAPIVLDGLKEIFRGKGNHPMKLYLEIPINIKGTSSKGKRAALMSGYIYYKPTAGGPQKSYRIYQQTYTTNW